MLLAVLALGLVATTLLTALAGAGGHPPSDTAGPPISIRRPSVTPWRRVATRPGRTCGRACADWHVTLMLRWPRWRLTSPAPTQWAARQRMLKRARITATGHSRRDRERHNPKRPFSA